MKTKLTPKQEIDWAIEVVSCTLRDYSFYLSCLSPAEKAEELQELNAARDVLKKYYIPFEDVVLHERRQENKPAEPVRFIDRPRFAAIELDDLPV